MLKMIIVDDEKIIRETIHSLIDWNSLGIDVAAVCKDGIEAFDCILDEYPDIGGGTAAGCGHDRYQDARFIRAGSD